MPMIGIWAFVVYLAIVIVWSSAVKRSMTEAMLIGLLVVSLFNGIGNYAQTLGAAIQDAATQEIFVATMLFVVMAAVMSKTDIIKQLVTILNSLIGGVKGGSAYVSTLGSALFGVISGNSVANAATVGTITIPWMIKSGWSKEMAATINTGNSGSGQSFPASSALFLMLGLPQVAAAVTILAAPGPTDEVTAKMRRRRCCLANPVAIWAMPCSLHPCITCRWPGSCSSAWPIPSTLP